MKQIVIVMCWLMPLFVNAQEKPSINFSKAANWNELLAESKKANKPIFIDAYATWCGPCKQMDKEVFTDSRVVDFINANFIPFKIQMDETSKDDNYTKNWQKESIKFSNYINGYPCYLFFTSDGKFSGREVGYWPVKEFLTALAKATDKENSYSNRLKKFNEGILGKQDLLALAFYAAETKDSNALAIATAYKKKYIDVLPVDTLLRNDNIRFIGTFYKIFSSSDPIIRYTYEHQNIADSIIKSSGYSARGLSDYVITKEFISPYIYKDNRVIPDFSNWKSLEKNISKKYDPKTAKRLVMSAKIAWAFKGERLEDAIRWEFEKIDAFGMDTSGLARAMFNNRMFGIVFKQVDNPKLLKKAVKLMKYVIDTENRESHSHLDTYASLLYKSGKKNQAIDIEKAALEMAKEEKNERNIRLYSDMIERMKKDEETWKLD